MIVVILAGGMGTRLQELTDKIPKPMVTIGGIPILWHLINNFADQGFNEFIIAGGYKHQQIKKYFERRYLGSLKVAVVNTGFDTKTAGRVARLRSYLTRSFILTYGDGLADINFRMLLEHHERMRTMADCFMCDPLVTLTAVNPPSRFGRLRIEDGHAKIFMEKGQDPEGWINAGFYVCEPEVLDLIPGDACAWEKDVLPALAIQDRLSAFQHTGEFQMMDTWRDREYLEELWKTGSPFWTRWGQSGRTG